MSNLKDFKIMHGEPIKPAKLVNQIRNLCSTGNLVNPLVIDVVRSSS